MIIEKAGIVILMMETVSLSETLVNLYLIHGPTAKDTDIFVLTAIRTSNPT
jgi:hypothetical protein